MQKVANTTITQYNTITQRRQTVTRLMVVDVPLLRVCIGANNQ